ncbi:hypothetical protein F2Q68_00044751 [Brassica cretica]|uniref:RNase H type-1 domain-containing protein n=1 Tax=Brassica cretica TaxID=69181 RepID=A0A8S9LN03_BRACR|nr:hypothetical protein F2Q68_00044751 [Brassica cretica]
MAMMYISHSDATERLQREQYPRDDSLNYGGLVIRRKIDDESDGETESSASKISVHSSPVAHSGFQLGPSSEGRVLRKPGNNGSQRKRPSSWKRKSLGQRSVEAGSASVEVQDQVTDRIGSSKRKSSFAIGDGRSTRVWLDNWILDPTPRPPRYNQDVLVDLTLTVNDLIILQTGRWNVDLVRQLIADEDVERVLNTKINLSRTDDERWAFSQNRRYDSRSGYKLIELADIQSDNRVAVKSQLRSRGWSHTSVFLNLHYLFAQSQSHNLGIVARLSFPWLLWQIWKARNKCCFEKVLPVASDIVSLAMDEATVWLKLHGVLPDFTSSNPLNQVTFPTWVKPSDSFLKCNADFLALSWSAATMSDLKMKKIIFEFSSIQGGLALEHPLAHPASYYSCHQVFRIINSIQGSTLHLIPITCNSPAIQIATSVTRDHRYRSYVARLGPNWLAASLSKEAS